MFEILAASSVNTALKARTGFVWFNMWIGMLGSQVHVCLRQQEQSTGWSFGTVGTGCRESACVSAETHSAAGIAGEQ